MLKINLLPVEKRKPERTPVPRFALILALAAIASSLIFYIIYVLIDISAITKTIEAKNKELADVREKVKDHAALQGQVATLRQEWQEDSSVAMRPFNWSLAIETLWDVIYQNDRIWIDSISILETSSAVSSISSTIPGETSRPYTAVVLRCNAAGNDPGIMTKFRMDLKTDKKLLKYFTMINISSDWYINQEGETASQFSIPFTVTLYAPLQAKPAIRLADQGPQQKTKAEEPARGGLPPPPERR